MNDWTSSWIRAAALALSAPTRLPLLSRPEAAGLLSRCLEETVHRHGLPLVAWAILPDGLHVIGLQQAPLPWTDGVGRVKQSFSSHARRRPWSPGGRIWRTEVRVRPLADHDVARAVAALHEMPVRAALCRQPEDWRWSSAAASATLPGRQAALTIVAQG